jgi:uncharacterized protein YcbX
MQEPVGAVELIARYPVKSMAGEPLPAVDLTFQGITGDRRHAFVQRDARGGFPWLTAREYPDLLRYTARPAMAGERRIVRVESPFGGSYPVDSADLLAELEERSGRRLFLLQDYRGNYDVAQVSLIALETIGHLSSLAGLDPQPARFRANLYLRTPGGTPFAEDAWVGHVLRIGAEARVAITETDDRCAMITLDPETAESYPGLLRTVAQVHSNKAGVYGVVLTPGTVQIGDAVHLE